MRDIAYFRSTLEPEHPDGPVGWSIAEALAADLRRHGAAVNAVVSSWDGVKFACRLDGRRFKIELTPYFEAQPLEWSVEVRPAGVGRILKFLSQSAHERLCELINESLTVGPEFSLLHWTSLSELAKQQSELSKQQRSRRR
jgi:hypothetical protein